MSNVLNAGETSAPRALQSQLFFSAPCRLQQTSPIFEIIKRAATRDVLLLQGLCSLINDLADALGSTGQLFAQAHHLPEPWGRSHRRTQIVEDCCRKTLANGLLSGMPYSFVRHLAGYCLSQKSKVWTVKRRNWQTWPSVSDRVPYQLQFVRELADRRAMQRSFTWRSGSSSGVWSPSAVLHGVVRDKWVASPKTCRP